MYLQIYMVLISKKATYHYSNSFSENLNQKFKELDCFCLFRKDCPISLLNNVPVIRGAITCNLGESCSDVVCCLYAEPLLKHVTIHLSLNYCQDRISIGIDKFVREIQPSAYTNWGK